MASPLADAANRLFECYKDSNPGGFCPTGLENVDFFWTDRPTAREPLSYPPGLAFILSGRKTGYLHGQSFDYGPGSYLAVGLPLVFECETHASKTEPLLGLFIRFDSKALSELSQVLGLDRRGSPVSDAHLGVEPLPVGAEMQSALTRLAFQACEAQAAAALGQGTVREILYHALRDRHGRVLLSLTRFTRPEARIAALLQEIEARGDETCSVDEMARWAAMSPATLHRHFKAVTGYAPVQYFKRQKLMKARSLLSDATLSVTQAAFAVGYKSASQFSRDYRRLFGHTPSAMKRRKTSQAS